MIKVLEAVPNLSEGRNLALIGELAGRLPAFGVDLVDVSSDADHHRSVLTFLGEPAAVEEASLEVARFALHHIDLRTHAGVHPRVGALDVLPFVPLHGISMAEAVASAHRVGRRIAGLGIPVYFYAWASDPPGRALRALRKGGFEALRGGFPPGREPDFPPGANAPHPTAGVSCVGARPVLLAWNVWVEGITPAEAREIAGKIRETGGGFAGLRALGLELPEAGAVQISMNLEDPERTSPLRVFEAIEEEVHSRGGTVLRTEVIGMLPDTLVLPSVVDRLHLPDPGPARVLSRRVSDHISRRTRESTQISDRTG